MADHIHMCLSVPPKYSVAHTIGFLRGKSAARIPRDLLQARRMTGLHFWATGYCVRTVGLDEQRIRPTIRPIGQEGKALQRCTLSARPMPGDGQEHWPQRVLLPSHPSSGRKATNLLNWGEAPSPTTGLNHYPPVGHMSISMGVVDYFKPP